MASISSEPVSYGSEIPCECLVRPFGVVVVPSACSPGYAQAAITGTARTPRRIRHLSGTAQAPRPRLQAEWLTLSSIVMGGALSPNHGRCCLHGFFGHQGQRVTQLFSDGGSASTARPVR